MSLSLKDHQFNCLRDGCFALLYHIDDMDTCLDKYKNTISDLIIPDSVFAEMEILKPIYTAIALKGVHITKSYHSILMDPSTKYSTLLQSFAQLHQKPGIRFSVSNKSSEIHLKLYIYFFITKTVPASKTS